MGLRVDPNPLRIVVVDDDTVVSLEPLQGLWTEAQSLTMTDHSRQRVEFDDGAVGVLRIIRMRSTTTTDLLPAPAGADGR